MAKRIAFQFDDALPHQRAAINAAIGIFQGQPRELGDTIYRGKVRHIKALVEGEYNKNRLDLTETVLLKNLNKVQAESGNILLDQELKKLGGVCNFTVEMETGTGKTYVYLRTILELYQNYNFMKFLIIVPTLPIRKGVEKSMAQLREHFRSLYGGLDILKHSFVYDPNNKGRLDDFAESRDLQIMIINTQAFNRDTNIIRKADERGKVYWDILRYVQPIVFIDEPQKMEGDGRKISSTMQSLLELDPLFILRYSATHKNLYNLINRLDSYHAFSQGLVKGIQVATVASEIPRNYPYIAYTKMTPDLYARIELFRNVQGKGVQRVYENVRKNADLYELSGNLPQYAGMRVLEDPHKKNGLLFGSPEHPFVLLEGKSNYEITDEEIVRIQIRLTIQQHLKRQLKVLEEGLEIKVLTLFFVDAVNKFRNGGIYARLFDEEYAKAIQDTRYNIVFKKYHDLFPRCTEVQNVREGYFAQDKKGKEIDVDGDKDWVNTKTPEEVELGIKLILERKDELISFEEPLAFLFSHSALREGWDNPNVFQICTLKHGASEIAKKQEIGRGLRLPVDISGIRRKPEDSNVLTVIANETYERFAEALQKDFNDEAGVDVEKVELSDVQEILREAGVLASEITAELAQAFLNELKAAKIIHPKTEQLDANKKEDILYITFGNDILKEHSVKIIEAFRSVMGEKGSRRLPVGDAEHEPPQNEFYSYMNETTFLELYHELRERVLQRTYYQVHIDNKALIRDCIDTLNNNITMDEGRRTITVMQGGVTVNAFGQLVAGEPEQVYMPPVQEDSINERSVFELVNYIMQHTFMPRIAVFYILQGTKHLKALQYQDVLDGAIRLIQEKLIEHKKKDIAYELLDGFVLEEKSVFDVEAIKDCQYYQTKEINRRAMTKYIRCDSEGEEKFARSLDDDENVMLFTKFKRGGLVINTPYGDYTPDWAVIYRHDKKTARLYFIIETKWKKTEETLQGVEKAKIDCARKHFARIGKGIVFDWVGSLERFWAVINKAKEEYEQRTLL